MTMQQRSEAEWQSLAVASQIVGNRNAIRLQKLLADRGVASRRHAADIVRSGRVTVDGVAVAEPGFRIDTSRAVVLLDGKPLPAAPRSRTIMLHKPRGYVCSTRGQGTPTVYELIRDIPETLKPAGRLDKESEGLLLMSNDGALIQDLTHPRHEHEKHYRVTVKGAVDGAVLKRLNSPMDIDGYRIRPARVLRLKEKTRPGTHVLEFVLREGRNRQVRKMCSLVGLRVQRLIRTRVGPYILGDLPLGRWRDARVLPMPRERHRDSP